MRYGQLLSALLISAVLVQAQSAPHIGNRAEDMDGAYKRGDAMVRPAAEQCKIR